MTTFDAENLFQQLGKTKYHTPELHLKGMLLFVKIGGANIRLDSFHFEPNGGNFFFELAKATEIDFVEQEREV